MKCIGITGTRKFIPAQIGGGI